MGAAGHRGRALGYDIQQIHGERNHDPVHSLHRRIVGKGSSGLLSMADRFVAIRDAICAFI